MRSVLEPVRTLRFRDAATGSVCRIGSRHRERHRTGDPGPLSGGERAGQAASEPRTSPAEPFPLHQVAQGTGGTVLGLTVRIVEDHFGHDLTLPSCGSITRGSNGSAVPIHLCTHVTRGGAPAFRCEEDRSAAERGVLPDATITCLVELGCAGTAGAAVAQKAGLSRGAQPHHCGTRDQLVVAGSSIWRRNGCGRCTSRRLSWRALRNRARRRMRAAHWALLLIG